MVIGGSSGSLHRGAFPNGTTKNESLPVTDAEIIPLVTGREAVHNLLFRQVPGVPLDGR